MDLAKQERWQVAPSAMWYLGQRQRHDGVVAGGRIRGSKRLWLASYGCKIVGQIR